MCQLCHSLHPDSAIKLAFVMKTNLKKHQPRWRISEETPLRLEQLRRLHGQKSWEEFFKEIIQRWDDHPSENNLLTRVERDLEGIIWVIQALETRNDELSDYLKRLTDLLSLALDEEDHSSHQKPVPQTTFGRFIQERS